MVVTSDKDIDEKPSLFSISRCPCNQVAVVWSPNPSHASSFEFCCGQTLSGQTWKLEDSPLVKRTRTYIEWNLTAKWQVKTWCSFLLDRHVRIISRKVRAGVKPKIPLESIWYQYVDSLLASNYLNNLYRFFIGSTCCPDCRVLCKQSGAHHPSQNTHLLGNGRFSGLGDCAAALLRDQTPRSRPYEDSKQSKRHKFRAWLGFFQARHNLHTSHTQ